MSKIILNSVRLSFPSLWETEKYNGQDTGKFGATFLIKKDDPQAKILKDAVIQAAEAKFGKPIPKTVKYCLNDGDEKEYDGYEGHWAIKATTKRRPVVIDQSKTTIAEADNKIYAGCYVNASIDIWCMDNNYGKRVLASLNGIQFAKDGESFGVSGNAMDDFSEIEVVGYGHLIEEDSPFA